MEGKRQSQDVGERRQSVRVTRPGSIRVRVEAVDLAGESENLSPTDLLFYSDEPLMVSLEYEQDGTLKQARGRVVRINPVQGERSGWAIEFE